MAAAKGRRRCLDDLPEDVLHKVFSGVGNFKDLFRLALTCRWWLRRFTDRAFLCGLLCPGQGAVGHRARLLGFFFKQPRNTGSPTFLPAPGSQLGAATLASFNDAEPLAARRGIVLMRLAPSTNTHRFGLCNPITGERHILPPLKYYGHLCGYAIITAADSDLNGASSSSGRFAFSQLLVLTNEAAAHVYLHSYSAVTRSWSVPTMCLDCPLLSLVGEKSAVVHHGAAHWLLIDHDHDLMYKLSAEVGAVRRNVSLTKLPVRVGGSPLLCVSRDGELSVACVYIMHVAVWKQQGGGDAAPWLRTVITIPVAVPNPKYSWRDQPREKWFDFGRGSMLVLARSSGVFLLDLEKKEMEKIMEDRLLPRFRHLRDENRSVAYEMDLVEFFLLQLGGLSCAAKQQQQHIT